ncbi:host attachment protein [Acetobacter sp.]|uniref:baeRF12 domain-containing protein n=1 Tax=Acetobacter sp. TaxID=440 RepID=UPI003D05FBC6
MRLPHDMVVVVADGSYMPLPKNHGDQAHPDLRVIGHRQMENPPNCELLWGAPGLGFASGYPGRNTFSKSDPRKANEARFVAGAAEALPNAADAANGLIVVAPPDALGELCGRYDSETRKTLVAEVHRDFVKHPLRRLRAYLALTR